MSNQYVGFEISFDRGGNDQVFKKLVGDSIRDAYMNYLMKREGFTNQKEWFADMDYYPESPKTPEEWWKRFQKDMGNEWSEGEMDGAEYGLWEGEEEVLLICKDKKDLAKVLGNLIIKGELTLF